MNDSVVVTVSQLNRYLKSIVEDSNILNSISVSGEVSNYVRYNKSGHIYMTLKDEDSSIKVVIFNRTAESLDVKLENGMNVVAFGKITVYERDGICQMIASGIREQGIGDEHEKLRKLKEKLLKEGLFDESHKKLIPKFPKRVGVITSKSGAALQDIIKTFQYRFPIARIVLYPSLVQGVKASSDISNGVRAMVISGNVDVIIIARGGGSSEDLHVFNDEMLARAVYDCKIPVISAIGHETDLSILDLVADARASTPTQAAMIASPDQNELLQLVDNCTTRMTNALNSVIKNKEEKFKILKMNPTISSFSTEIRELNRNVYDLISRMNISINTSLSSDEKDIALNAEKLSALSPLSVLSRGYGILYKNGKTVTDTDIYIGDTITIRSNSKFIDTKVLEERGL